MALKERLSQDFRRAQQKREVLKISVLSMLLSSLHNREIDKRTKLSKAEPLDTLSGASRLSEEEVLEVVGSEAKKRRESIMAFEKGRRQDLVDQEKKELLILEVYLPKQLSDEEIRSLAKETIQKTNAKTLADTGKIMGELMPKVRGRAGGNEVSRIVRELLS